ncbi:MAG: CHAT domain-containing protein [Verrucomicrobiota bacterium]|nr:CHAT domain-containing protein [Verrucomicrobiota bacterium]
MTTGPSSAAGQLVSQTRVFSVLENELMGEFIRRWRAGEPRAKAWREAQSALLRSKEFANPYFCATFRLPGQWR